MRDTSERGQRRAHGDGGSSLVEFAFVMVLLFTLIFGIISFGLILSFKQDMTRAAAEGARAGAVAVAQTGEVPATVAEAAATTATNEAVRDFGGSFKVPGCARAGLDNCNDIGVAACADDSSKLCVTVHLEFDYENNPLYGEIPLISQFMPDTIEATSVARINE